ncbi:MAG TPA: hypothetical protein VFK52_09105 [Nocardioidaceae bacterium]|nr:hypothetical protein [Nocardioidaceae bacterium]
MDTSSLLPAFQASGPFATALVDVSHDSETGAHAHELRVREVCDALTTAGAGPDVVEPVRDRLLDVVHWPAPVARLVVANADGVLVDAAHASRVDRSLGTWSALPDLATWVRQRAGDRTFVLALVDHTGGRVSVHDSATPAPLDTTEVTGQTLHVQQVASDDWANLKYQHTTENVWAANAEEVAEAIRGRVAAGHDLVLLAGDPQSRPLVRESLGDQIHVVELDTGSRSADGGDAALDEAVRHALNNEAMAIHLELQRELSERLGRGEGAASGVDAVADALVRGQVEVLLLDPDEAAGCTLDVGSHPGFPVGELGVVPADQGLIAAAVLTGAQVSPLPARALGGAPVAALLRWAA